MTTEMTTMTKTIRHSTSTLVIVALMLMLTACRDIAIVHDLDERDANGILVVLSKHGIAAQKEKVEKNQEVKWSVTVSPANEIPAQNILLANNLPKVRHGGLSGICKDAGLILTPKTEKCREILAYKGEIINSLESIPGVVSADVVLNIPDKEEFADPNAAVPHPTASVTVEYLKEANKQTPLTEAKVQEFVSNSVSGLDSRDVAVIISYLESGVPLEDKPDDKAANPGTVALATTADSVVATGVAGEDAPELTAVGGLKMDEASAKKFKLVTIVFLLLFLCLTGAFIFVLLKMAQLKKRTPIQAKPAESEAADADKKLLGS